MKLSPIALFLLTVPLAGCSKEPVDELEELADEVCDCDLKWCVEMNMRKIEIKVDSFSSGEMAKARKRWDKDVTERWNKAQERAKECAKELHEDKE